jgi:sulfate permease, SulP family
VLTAGGIALVGQTGDRAAAATLALLAGLVLVTARLLRLGFVTNFISTPVLVGFKAGMGLYIAASQLGKVLGIPIPRGGFLHNVWQAIRHLGSANGTTVVLSAVTIAVMILLARVVPIVPAALAAVVVGIAGQLIFDLESHGVALIGHIPSGLPSLALPTFAHTADLLPAALGIALMSAIESSSAARAFARPEAPRLNVNREWLALGAAKVAVSFVRGFPAGGGTS